MTAARAALVDDRAADESRELDLPGGRHMIVRPMDRTDARGLGLLYAALSLDDRYHRFFSAYRPSADVLEHMAEVGEHGGWGCVAALVDARGHEEIVGEATFSMLPDGNGELGITVARDWRGWLGPYLLDRLVAAAACRGVPNIEADVLTDNRAMLRLLRARHCVTLSRSDPAILRVGIAAAQPVQAPKRASGYGAAARRAR